MARAPEPFSVSKPVSRKTKGISMTICVVLLAAVGAGGYHVYESNLPDWQRDPQGLAPGWAWGDVKRGLEDSRYGNKDADSYPGETIIGDCAALIPSIRKAMADGKLTNLEVHDLHEAGADFQGQAESAEAQNEALGAVGKPLLPVVDCPHGADLFNYNASIH